MNLTTDQVTFTLFHPFSMFFVGPSRSGKTFSLLDLIHRRDECISEKLDRVLYIYGADSPEYHKFAETHPDTTFTPFFDESLITPNMLLIYDDMQQEISGSMNNFITHLITKCVHHSKISVIIVLHNLYSKNLRTASLSTDYLALFNYPRDRSILAVLSRQVCPQQSRFLREAYDFATNRKKFGYLFLDLHQLQNPHFKFRTGIFNDPDTYLVLPS